MNSLQTFFSKLSAKSQPEVGLSQELAGMKEVNHSFDNNNNNNNNNEYSYYISIPTSTAQQQQQQLPINAMTPDMNIGSYGLSTTTSFGSFSSAADSLIHENQAIFVPNYTPNQDFCLMDDPILISSSTIPSSSSVNNDPSLQLLSTSACESDISFCSPSTPHNGMLSPFNLPNHSYDYHHQQQGLYCNSSPSSSSTASSTSSAIAAAANTVTTITSPGTLLANAMNHGLNLQSSSSPSTTPLINVNDIMLSPSLSSYPPFSPLTNASLDQLTCSPSPSFYSMNHQQLDDTNNNNEWLWEQWQLLQETNPNPMTTPVNNNDNNNTNIIYPSPNLFDINLPCNNNDNDNSNDSTGTIIINFQDNNNTNDEDEDDQKNKKKNNKKKPLEFNSNNKKKVTKKPPTRHGKHQCPHCPRTSNRSNNMKEHILTHDPNRPKNFACEMCNKRFARKHDLKRHHDSHLRSMRKFIKDFGFIPFNIENLNQQQQQQQE